MAEVAQDWKVQGLNPACCLHAFFTGPWDSTLLNVSERIEEIMCLAACLGFFMFSAGTRMYGIEYGITCLWIEGISMSLLSYSHLRKESSFPVISLFHDIGFRFFWMLLPQFTKTGGHIVHAWPSMVWLQSWSTKPSGPECTSSWRTTRKSLGRFSVSL